MKTTIILLLIFNITLYANCTQNKGPIEAGECFEKQNNLNRAQASYEQAILEDDTNTQARIKLAQLYQKMQMPTQASAVLVDVNENQLTPAQRSSLGALISHEEDSLTSFKARVKLGGGYDSNINIASDDALSNTTSEPLATLFSRLSADLSYVHDLQEQGSWFLRSDLNFYYQNNEAAHYYDALYARLYVGAGYQGNGFSLYMPLFYDQLHYLDRDLLQEYGLRPDANIQLQENLIVNINAMYSMRRYIQASDALRDDDLLSLGAGLFYFQDQNIWYLKTRYEMYSAQKESTLLFIDKTMLYAIVGGIYTIQDIADLHLNYQYRYGDFKEVNAIKRDDGNHDLMASLEKDFLKQWRMSATYHYINNTSNYVDFQYNKHELMLSLAYNY